MWLIGLCASFIGGEYMRNKDAQNYVTRGGEFSEGDVVEEARNILDGRHGPGGSGVYAEGMLLLYGWLCVNNFQEGPARELFVDRFLGLARLAAAVSSIADMNTKMFSE